MSSDLEVLEMLPVGSAVNITQVLIMANTTGMDAAEALSSTTHGCNTCRKTNIHFSKCIIVNIVGNKRTTLCKQCYMETVMDDPDDSRASRGTAAGGGDTELSGMQWRRDKTDNENRPIYHA